MSYPNNQGVMHARALAVLILTLTLSGSMACTPARGQIPAFGGASESRAAVGEQTAVLAGGCFWGVDAVFKHVKGVSTVVSGYSGGSAATAHYDIVSTGMTGHAEAVKITFDPARISYSELLRIFFSVATDPTELNRQGPDTGTQYRSVIFYTNEGQKQTALAYIDQLNQARVFPAPIVTQVVPLKAFYPAEEYHQNFLERNPHHPYIVFNDLPKLRELEKRFPDLYEK
ncbi:MAG TPA: peptide-methionine (S)-S-oxide reductase MsrA [Terriglobia bacterium]|nr:peptide-methionine (S)-S-oxide reductase MsrA [Terriglobia bacterium]